MSWKEGRRGFVNRGKVALAALLLIGSVPCAAPPASAQIYPSCPPGYFFAPAYGLCFPAGYFYDPGYSEYQGYYPYAPDFGFAPFAVFGSRFGGLHHHFGHGIGHGFGGHGGFVGQGRR
jgi:hypothetical protein